jgi:hypothetical protein
VVSASAKQSRILATNTSWASRYPVSEQDGAGLSP